MEATQKKLRFADEVAVQEVDKAEQAATPTSVTTENTTDGREETLLKQVRDILAGYTKATRDEERFVALLLLAKCDIGSLGEESFSVMIPLIHDAIGYAFPVRLLRSSGSELSPMYNRIGLSVVALYARSSDLAAGTSFQQLLPAIASILGRLCTAQEEADTAPASTAESSNSPQGPSQASSTLPTATVSDSSSSSTAHTPSAPDHATLEAITEAVNTLTMGVHSRQHGADISFLASVLDALLSVYRRFSVVDDGFLAALLSLLGTVGMFISSSPVTQREQPVFAATVMALVHIFSQRKDAMQFTAASVLSAVLQAVSPGFESPQGSVDGASIGLGTDWMDTLLRTCKHILTNKLGEQERMIVFQLISLATHHIPLTALPSATINDTLPLIARRAAIEVRINLELPSLDECVEHAELLACCLDIIEETILALASHEDDDLSESNPKSISTECVENALQACKMGVSSIVFFFSNCAEEGWDITQLCTHDKKSAEASLPLAWLLACACMRVLDRWLTSWSADDQEEVEPVVVFLLNLLGQLEQGSSETQTVHQRAIRESNAHLDALAALFPGLYALTENDESRERLLDKTHYVELCCKGVLHAAFRSADNAPVLPGSTSTAVSTMQSGRGLATFAARQAKQGDILIIEGCNVLLNVLVQERERAQRISALRDFVARVEKRLEGGDSLPFTEKNLMLTLVCVYAVIVDAGSCSAAHAARVSTLAVKLLDATGAEHQKAVPTSVIMENSEALSLLLAILPSLFGLILQPPSGKAPSHARHAPKRKRMLSALAAFISGVQQRSEADATPSAHKVLDALRDAAQAVIGAVTAL